MKPSGNMCKTHKLRFGPINFHYPYMNFTIVAIRHASFFFWRDVESSRIHVYLITIGNLIVWSVAKVENPDKHTVLSQNLTPNTEIKMLKKFLRMSIWMSKNIDFYTNYNGILQRTFIIQKLVIFIFDIQEAIFYS